MVGPGGSPHLTRNGVFPNAVKGVSVLKMTRKNVGKTGGRQSRIKGWDTYKGGGIDFKGSYPSAHYVNDTIP